MEGELKEFQGRNNPRVSHNLEIDYPMIPIADMILKGKDRD
jgi:hypothetical protein